jgi:Bacterial EndoU nuclease
MDASTVTIRRIPGGFELINWTDESARTFGNFLITDAPHALEKLEAFLGKDSDELLLPGYILKKHDELISISDADQKDHVAQLSLARFVGLLQEWLFFLKNDSPELKLYLMIPESQQQDIDPSKVHIAVGQYGGQHVISTRFPRAWDKEMITQKVQEALERVIEGTEDKVIGITKDGIVLQMYVKNGQIFAVFPSKLYNIQS